VEKLTQSRKRIREAIIYPINGEQEIIDGGWDSFNKLFFNLPKFYISIDQISKPLYAKTLNVVGEENDIFVTIDTIHIFFMKVQILCMIIHPKPLVKKMIYLILMTLLNVPIGNVLG
jgi:hypothetical protein